MVCVCHTILSTAHHMEILPSFMYFPFSFVMIIRMFFSISSVSRAVVSATGPSFKMAGLLSVILRAWISGNVSSDQTRHPSHSYLVSCTQYTYIIRDQRVYKSYEDNCPCFISLTWVEKSTLLTWEVKSRDLALPKQQKQNTQRNSFLVVICFREIFNWFHKNWERDRERGENI